MCICINCLYVYKCSTYHFVTLQHQGSYKHDDTNTLFNPSYSILHANYIEINNHHQLDWDVIECLSFIEQPGSWTRVHD
uniref:Uncharacterized protein n=1 Tax=Neoizziella asiatica TaxID=1077397 RepID=A0A1G4NXB3_9FLOR|nr:Hypothetical protein ycf34 [Neoizziella asiatica]SCW23156.1 Hypothetical protein ycf34 [Neoizziella asiatica]